MSHNFISLKNKGKLSKVFCNISNELWIVKIIQSYKISKERNNQTIVQLRRKIGFNINC